MDDGASIGLGLLEAEDLICSSGDFDEMRQCGPGGVHSLPLAE